MNLSEFINSITDGRFDEQFRMLYGSSERAVLRARARCISAAESFSRLYPEDGDVRIFTAPAASLICGAASGDQCGSALAAAVSLDVIAMVMFHKQGIIRVKSEGCDDIEVRTDSLEMRENEKGTAVALIRGTAAGFAEKGTETGGFDAYIVSDVLSGSSLMLSSAFEALIAAVINEGFNGGKADAAELAAIGRYAESNYFGRPCDIITQAASAYGGFIYAGSSEGEAAEIKAISLDLGNSGYSLCITDTARSGEKSGGTYAEETGELKKVAGALGCESLCEADEEEFYKKLPELRGICTDTELLSAAYSFAESRRAAGAADALSDGDTERFFEILDGAGASTAEHACKGSEQQGVSLAAILSRRFLRGNGAVVYGGLPGTVQAFVPSYLTSDYEAEMERVFGAGSCYVLTVRPVGGYELKI